MAQFDSPPRSPARPSACLVAIGSTASPAQFPAPAGPPIDMGSPVADRVGAGSRRRIPPNKLPEPTNGPQRVRYTLTLPRPDLCQQARTANRYTVARPVYNGRHGVSYRSGLRLLLPSGDRVEGSRRHRLPRRPSPGRLP